MKSIEKKLKELKDLTAKLSTLKAHDEQCRLKPKEVHKVTTKLATMTVQVSREELKYVHPFNIAEQFALFRTDTPGRHQQCVGEARTHSVHAITMLVDYEAVHRGIRENPMHLLLWAADCIQPPTTYVVTGR